MTEENEIRKIIGRCLRGSKPLAPLYGKNDDGSYFKIRDGAVADIEQAAEALEYEIDNYLRMKEAEINNKLTQAKCDAYELALTHSRPIERIRENEECES